MEYSETTVLRDGMEIDWDVPITMEDGVVLRCDVYRPVTTGNYPVIITYGPYGKGLHFEDLYTEQWRLMCEEHPDVPAGSTNKYQNWEVVDPEKWVPDGYVCIRVDSRGAGRSPGVMDIWSLREAQDFAQCIDWAGIQSWANGKVAINGISYYAMNAWKTASLQPEHLAAVIAWEGAADFYRDMAYHGGILCNGFSKKWSESQVYSVQHGRGSRGFRSRFTGDWVSGPAEYTDEQLGSNRREFFDDVSAAKLDTDGYWQSRMPDWNKVDVPFLSSGNWGGQGLHPRGNFEAFVRAASSEKHLEVHGREHWTEFYTDYGVQIQKQFLGHYLKGEDTGWDKKAKVQLLIRHPGEVFVARSENEWPLARTEWTKSYLDTSDMTLQNSVPNSETSAGYSGFGDGLTFLTPPFLTATEITGPMMAKLHVSSETADADLFLVVRAFTPDLKEIVFHGALDPNTPIAQGWLRVSHRKLDPDLSLSYRPYHTHDEVQPMTPGEIYEVDVEIWPSCIALPAGYRLALSVRGRDYVYTGGASAGLETLGTAWTGCGPFQHNDPVDRPAEVFGGRITVYSGPRHPSWVLLPIIPEK